MKHLAVVSLWVVVISVAMSARAQSPGADSSTTVSKTFGDWKGISTTAGIRLWGNTWDRPAIDILLVANAQAPGGVVLRNFAESHTSAFEIAPIPFIGVRVGDVVTSLSYLVRTHYDTNNPILQNVSRDELDLTLGYSMLPASSDASIVVSLAYKRAQLNEMVNSSIGQSVDTSSRINAGLIGLSGNAPLTDNLRLYGNVAYGLARQNVKTPSGLTTADSTLDGAYRVGELGLSYTFFRGSDGQAVRAASVSLGYRAQIYTVKSFPLQSTTLGGTVLATEYRDLDSTTRGAILALSASF